MGLTARLGAPLAALALLTTAVAVSPTTATAAPVCVPQTPTAPAHEPTKASPSGLTATLDPNVGTIGKVPSMTAKAWDGADRVKAIAQIGSTVYVGGVIDRFVKSGVSTARSNVAAYNADTGALLPWAPQINGEVNAITPSCDGTGIFIAGSFNRVDGKYRPRIVKVDAITGTVLPFYAVPNKEVTDVRYLNGHLTISGYFSNIGTTVRNQTASLNDQTGAVDGWLNLTIAGGNPAGDTTVRRIVPNQQGTHAVLLGNMATINGAAHRRIAVLSITGATASVTGFNSPLTNANVVTPGVRGGTDCLPQFALPEKDVAWLPDGSAFVTASTGGPNPASVCDTLAKWSGNPSTFTPTVQPIVRHYTGGDTLSAVACTMRSCVAIGHHRWADSEPTLPKVVAPVCNNTVKPYNLKAGYVGYDCQSANPVVRPGCTEVDVVTFKATPFRCDRALQRTTEARLYFTDQGLVGGSDGDTWLGQASNDLSVLRYAS